MYRPLLATAGLLFGSLPSFAGNACTSLAAGNIVNQPFSLGYVFTVSSSQSLTALGQFDVGGNGVAATAKVALFNWDTGAKLVETTLAGAMLEETGHYDTHFVSIPPVTLLPGTRYLLATEVAANDFVYGNGIMTFDSAVQWSEGRATPVGSPAMPGTANTSSFAIARTNEASGSYFGPNIKLDIPTPSSGITLTSPTSRAIFQRSASNVGGIPVSGTFSGAPDRIEARAVVMSGAGNSGSTTDWQTITNAPTGGVFSGTLGNVPSGGWYQLEVRCVTDGTPGAATVVQKVGVGDIYVTCGQSNSANYGQGGYTASDDRVCARTSVSGSAWTKAADPMPIAGGSGGSVWPRLGDLLAAEENIPIGFIAVGVGSTQVNQWVPASTYYETLLKPAIQSFPANGFRAVLWHQGESDAIALTSAATYAQRANSMIAQSRVDAGWQVPWYLAEASFHPNTTLGVEEPVAAGQRAVIHGDPLVFFGPSTDAFHLEDANGGKLVDSVHFNNAGLLDHATQWHNILRGTMTLAPRNSNFEDNRDPVITGLVPLADGASHIVNTTSDNDSPLVLGWRILSASGTAAADGSNGFHNPSAGTYAAAVDSNNGGVLPNMLGKHVAKLDGGSSGNYFLQSTRVLAAASTHYKLTVTIGVRDNPTTFGNARLELTANGNVVASQAFTKAVLDTLRGGDSSGTFTDASVTWNTSTTVAANQPLAIRIVKEGGAGTVIDFDNVRLTAEPVPNYQSWIGDPAYGIDPGSRGFDMDPDMDGLENGLEAWFGTHPGQPDAALGPFIMTGNSLQFSHPINLNPPGGLSGSYRWSANLSDWYAGDGQEGAPSGLTVTILQQTIGSTAHVTATANQAADRLFLRAAVTLVP